MERVLTMRRLIALSACISVLALAGAARAETNDPETARFMCEMAGDCGDGNAEAAAPSAPAPVSGARTSSTRGFSFKRATSEGTPAAAPAPAPTRMASAPSLRQSLQRPAAVGSADLRLSFITGSAILAEDAKVRLGKYAAALNNPKLATRRVRIEGHTDASGSTRSNQALSQRRAQAVADFLIANGVPAARFEVVGYGSSKPLAGIPSSSAANRRVMAVLL
jgi:outer membrane protein OmpA-like peptidoglycan-associated protein